MRVLRHGLQTVRGIYAIRFAMKRMYYILCLDNNSLSLFLNVLNIPI